MKMETKNMVALQTILFICDLCNDAVSSLDYVVSDGKVINE